MKNHFETGGSDYSKYRPNYPNELIKQLSSLVNKPSTALDIGCGTGQLTALLADHFETVIGVDSSENQLVNAEFKPNITYTLGSAENIPTESNSADLIVAAQAAHWFDLSAFYEEVRRVAKPSAIIALIGYGLPTLTGIPNAMFQKAYWLDLRQYWPPERQLIELGYSTLDFPFHTIEMDELTNEKRVTLDELIGYIGTWSATKRKLEEDAHYLTRLHEALRAVWGNEEKQRALQWPIFAKVAKVKG
ncbi:class I SAM-dependent methyltransferase [Alteromonas sp. a30]|uniref:class I SAM-dependent methyltransferase n=1 Tax=Alteromonas sp. a30 TaxID=2730917 RepID=UPI002282B63A|nr:class I SAM-dependent methyltransferase [Alteromonas sp. a30]MCY7295043.1 class I SAM-dependent methyltransferase [Alteromonas sp. a30]